MVKLLNKPTKKSLRKDGEIKAVFKNTDQIVVRVYEALFVENELDSSGLEEPTLPPSGNEPTMQFMQLLVKDCTNNHVSNMLNC